MASLYCRMPICYPSSGSHSTAPVSYASPSLDLRAEQMPLLLFPPLVSELPNTLLSNPEQKGEMESKDAISRAKRRDEA